MIPAPRLRLKRSTGWFAAGQEMAMALPLLSDAAFKLYVFLCLNVNRHSARMVWEPMELANLLQRDRAECDRCAGGTLPAGGLYPAPRRRREDRPRPALGGNLRPLLAV